MSKTQQIAEKLGLKVLNRLQWRKVMLPSQVFKNGEVADLPEGELEDGVYLVEKDGQKFVLKTGKFNEREVEDNQKLGELGVPVRKVISHQPGEYILYEYLDAPTLAQKDFWTDENIKRVLTLQTEMEEKLAVIQLTPEQVQTGKDWIGERITKEWLNPCVPKALTEEQAQGIRDLYTQNEELFSDIVPVFRDNNADHYVDSGDKLAVIDVDISAKPRYYMNMRYLSWVFLNAPKEQIGDPVAWAQKWAEYLNAEPKHFATWLVSLVGILWDIYGNEGSPWQKSDKTEDIKQVLNWVIGKLSKKEEPL